jgi:hypothetical protein
MSFPPVIDLQSYHRAKDESSLGTPGAAEAIKVASEFIDSLPLDIRKGCHLSDSSGVLEAALKAAFAPPAIDPPPTPSVAPPPPPGMQGEAGSPNSQVPFTSFCTETPISQPISPTPEVCDAQTGTGEAGTTPRAKGSKPPTLMALSAGDDLLVFDIHNMFRCRWFLSWDHLVANAILAQKAKDRKIFWVEFAPQFHAHLVKCAVVLVPCPLHKVKKVMFGYILELLNGEGPQAFFDLTMGLRRATQAQREKR